MFLAFFGIFWFWFLWLLRDGDAVRLAEGEANTLLSMVIGSAHAYQLFIANSPTYSVFFYVALTTLPAFCIFAASGQTASDVSSKLMRFIDHRCSRIEIYLGRFIGTSIFVLSAYLIVSVSAMFLAMAVETTASAKIIAYTVHVAVVLCLYALAFVAFMSAVTALCASVGISSLTAGCTVALVTAVSAFLAVRWPEVKILGYLIPNGMKQFILLKTINHSPMVIVPPLLLYTTVYFVFGLLIFRKREI